MSNKPVLLAVFLTDIPPLGIKAGEEIKLPSLKISSIHLRDEVLVLVPIPGEQKGWQVIVPITQVKYMIASDP